MLLIRKQFTPLDQRATSGIDCDTKKPAYLKAAGKETGPEWLATALLQLSS
jgi:hypothetical protein